MATAPNTFRALLRTEGSLVGGLGSAPYASWPTLSKGTYNYYIRNGGCPTAATCREAPAIEGTGAKTLNLPMVTGGVGGSNVDLTRRPPPAEDVNNPILFGERLFGKASLRILLSDRAADITNLPTVTATAPIPLGEVAGVAPNWLAAVPVDPD